MFKMEFGLMCSGLELVLVSQNRYSISMRRKDTHQSI